MALEALIFDVDGTLAETEDLHLAAFNAAFADEGLAFFWDEKLYRSLLRVAGGKERLLAFWQRSGLAPAGPQGEDLRAYLARVHATKTRHYTRALAAGDLGLRPGVARLIAEARAAGLKVALATTTTPDNLAPLLTGAFGPDWREAFDAVGDGHSAPIKKPDPLVYVQVAASMGVAPEHCLAIEDSMVGLAAARAAGMRCLVTPSRYTAGDNFAGAWRVLPDLGDLHLADLGGEACLAR